MTAVANSIVFLFYVGAFAFVLGFAAAQVLDAVRRWRRAPHRRQGTQL